MNILDFDNIMEAKSSLKEIEDFIFKNLSGFVLRIKIDGARQYSDLAYNYAEAAYLSQQFSEFAQPLSYSNQSTGYFNFADLGLKPTNVSLLAQRIFFYADLLSGDFNSDEWSEHVENLENFRENLHKLPIAFPELANDYLANYINGQYFEIQGNFDDEEEADNSFFNSEFIEFPERSFQFWQMTKAGQQGKIYGSRNTWIISPNVQLQDAIIGFSESRNLNFEPAELFVINNISYLISKGLLIHFPFDELIRSRACVYSAIERPNLLTKNDWINSIFTYNPHYNPLNPPPDTADKSYYSLLNIEVDIVDKSLPKILGDKSGFQYYLSSFGDQALIIDGEYKYVIWNVSKPNQQELLLLNRKLSEIFLVSTRLAGIVAEIHCNWDNIDDDRFEELCMDILACNPKFNHSTMRKMGKSKSRDGGRDIEIWTHRRFQYEPEKYIYQCKLLKKATSLTATKVVDISDIIDQFGAQGYGVMTNVVIDSTLYDKLDRLAASKGTKMDPNSVYNLERTLLLFPQIRKKYFGN